ncbi:MAG: hypothetical protein ACTHKU_11200 [Verrucomicrobiota bacterium]
MKTQHGDYDFGGGTLPQSLGFTLRMRRQPHQKKTGVNTSQQHGQIPDEVLQVPRSAKHEHSGDKTNKRARGTGQKQR